MRIAVMAALLFLSVGFWLAINQKENIGRLPSDEEVIFTQERNKATGELLNLEVVRCRICGQILSYTHFHLNGKLADGHAYTHKCGKYLAHYNRSGMGPTGFNFVAWLEKWQQRLRVKK